MLKNKVVVITGGSGLLGEQFIREVVNQGGIGIIADIDEKSGNKLMNLLSNNEAKKNVEFVKIDITSEKSIESAISYLDKKYGKVDAIVNNAYPRNSNYGKHFFDVNHKDFVENLGLNLGGYFTTSQVFSKYFKRQGYGNIVNISSVYGVIAPRFEIYKDTSMTMPVEYSVIKSGLIHLTKYMAKYFKGMNIRVNTISPGGILDNQPELFLEKYKGECLNKGMLDKSDLKGTLVYLLSDMSKFVNGQNIVVDDGFTI